MATFQISSGEWNELTPCTAFDGERQVASGTLRQVAAGVRELLDQRGDKAAVLIFNDATAHPIEVDFRGSVTDVLARLPQPATETDTDELPEEEAPRRRGRPRLGVIAREVTLLPRHWEWLSTQPGGASVALRKLVEAARRSSAGADEKRRSQEAAYRFMSTMAGNRAGFEEAARALFAGDARAFDLHTANWAPDLRAYAKRLACAALAR